jgi:small subunit ribosomal protein S15
MLTKRKKANEIAKGARHDTDTGSPEVQVAILTRRIEELSAHLDKNRKDKHSRRGLLGLVADRRKHLSYLEKTNKRMYGSLVRKLGLKK